MNRPDDRVDESPRLARSYLEAGSGAVGAGVGALIGGPAGGVVGAAAPPLLMQAWDWIATRRHERAERMLVAAAANNGESVEQFLQGAKTDVRREVLLGRCVTAAANTALVAKVLLLSRVLAAGFADDAKLDQSQLLADVIADIESPHIQVLNLMSRFRGRDEPVTPRLERDLDGANTLFQLDHFTERDLKRQLPNLSEGLAAILATLVARGLIREKTPDFKRMFQAFRSRSDFSSASLLPMEITNTEQAWLLASLGIELLVELEAVGGSGADASDGSTQQT